ncbi:MAG TPA: glycosyltransferase family 4 protein [Candidatus Thermoplasmatota archaeon]|nr:glycosyltransferase family 4 protein [Candidatus Thermoplasmatota archaeon]
MKVAMIGWEFPPFLAGGLGVHCLELTLQLAKLGVEIDFYMPRVAAEGDLRVADAHRHLNIIEVEAEPIASPYGGTRKRGYDAAFNDAVAQYNARLAREFRSHDADLIHAHDWITAPAALHLRGVTGKPLVWTCHSTEWDRSAGFYPQSWIMDVERRVSREADAVISVSRYTGHELARLYGADRSRLVPVHNGVDFAKFSTAAERDYGAVRRRVLFLSRVSRQKGPMHFMEMARRVLRSRRDVEFVVAGKGEMLGEMVRFAAHEGIARNVTFAGYVPEDRLPEVYRQSDVYVLPSVSEPFGISVLEAMTSGLPTIVSKTTGVGENLAHVLKTDYWDADEMADLVLSLLDHRVLRETLGRNGALEVRKFTWAACGRKTKDVYEGVLGRGRPARGYAS